MKKYLFKVPETSLKHEIRLHTHWLAQAHDLVLKQFLRSSETDWLMHSELHVGYLAHSLILGLYEDAATFNCKYILMRKWHTWFTSELCEMQFIHNGMWNTTAGSWRTIHVWWRWHEVASFWPKYSPDSMTTKWCILHLFYSGVTFCIMQYCWHKFSSAHCYVQNQEMYIFEKKL